MKYASILLAISLVMIHPSGWAFYCGQSLVQEGDYELQVLQKCGEPDFSKSRVEYRTSVFRISEFYYPGLDLVRQEPVYIDEWTYDFGRRRFMQWLHFENGQLINIRDLSYGTVNGTP